MPDRPSPRVWALPDGRVAVAFRSFMFGEVWLLVDDEGRTAVTIRGLGPDAVEMFPAGQGTR
jgi:hypothetical protein